MKGAITIAEAAATLIADPRPILCLDTCDFLDVVRGFEEDGNNHSAMVHRLVDPLISSANNIQPVITYLVRHEWEQNVDAVGKRASAHLRETDRRIARVLNSCGHVEIQAAEPPANFASLPLVQALVELAERLMDRAMVLERDDPCVERALVRVMERRRPSHQGAIKDSIHLEHYLEFSRRLDQARFSEPRLFVSGNKADFWEGPPRIHRELGGELHAVGLQFLGKLDAALGQLGI